MSAFRMQGCPLLESAGFRFRSKAADSISRQLTLGERCAYRSEAADPRLKHPESSTTSPKRNALLGRQEVDGPGDRDGVDVLGAEIELLYARQ